MVIPVVIDALGKVTKGLAQGLGNKKTTGDNPNDCFLQIGQNTKTSPVDLKTCCH